MCRSSRLRAYQSAPGRAGGDPIQRRPGADHARSGTARPDRMGTVRGRRSERVEVACSHHGRTTASTRSRKTLQPDERPSPASWRYFFLPEKTGQKRVVVAAACVLPFSPPPRREICTSRRRREDAVARQLLPFPPRPLAALRRGRVPEGRKGVVRGQARDSRKSPTSAKNVCAAATFSFHRQRPRIDSHPLPPLRGVCERGDG